MRRLVRAVIALTLGLPALPPGVALAGEPQREQTQTQPKATVWFKASTEVREARAKLREGNAEAAVQLAETALTRDLRFTDQRSASNILCIGYVELDAPLRALPHCDNLVRMGPREWNTYNNRANAYFALGRFDKALADYKSALKLARKAEKAEPDRTNADTPATDRTSNIVTADQIARPTAVVRKNLEMVRSRLKSGPQS